MSQTDLLRRRFLGYSVLGAGSLSLPGWAQAAPPAGRGRFVFVLQRGAADGLHIVAPLGDPDYLRLRGSMALDGGLATRLDPMFALHPAMSNCAALFQRRQALFAHAMASPYRERSHFDGQNVLETGGQAPDQLRDGWLNRVLPRLSGTQDAIALAPTVPTALRGAAAVTAYAPNGMEGAPEDLLQRVTELYAGDEDLRSVWGEALMARNMAGEEGRGKAQWAVLGRLAARFLARPDGARVAMIETGGWDTHTAQARRLDTQLKGLDTLIGALQEGLGERWQETVILVATEFGRTAAANGTGGSDHGTASLAMLFGGGVNGGRVIGEWPGLSQERLYQGRDLAPTGDLDGLIAAALAQCFRMDAQQTAGVFPHPVRQGMYAGLIA